MVTARVAWALSVAESLGLLPDPDSLARATGYLTQQLARAAASDHEARAPPHALALRGKASFETANALNRARG